MFLFITGGLDDLDLAGGGCLDLDDPTADFEFVPAMTPKGKGSRAAPAFAPSPVREEPEEEEEEEPMEDEKPMDTKEAMDTEEPMDTAEPAVPSPAAPSPVADPEPEPSPVVMAVEPSPGPRAVPVADTDATPDDFEAKLLAAMAAAEQGGGLSALGGGVANTPRASLSPIRS